MIKKTSKTHGFLSGLVIILLIVPLGAQASSSALTSIDYPAMTADVHQSTDPGGRIAVNYFENSNTPSDRFRSILATPVPELAAMLLLGFLLNGLWGGTRKLGRN